MIDDSPQERMDIFYPKRGLYSVSNLFHISLILFLWIIGNVAFAAKPHIQFKKSHTAHTLQKSVKQIARPLHAAARHSPVRPAPAARTTQVLFPRISSLMLTHGLPSSHRLALINTLHLAGALPSHEHSSSSFLKIPSRKDMVAFVGHAVSTLRHNHYRLGGGRFDLSRGIYSLDCSRFVDKVLSQVYPAAFSNLVTATGTGLPATLHYYNFFSDLSHGQEESHWNRIDRIGQLRPGDILVFRYKNLHGRRTSGHVMVVMEKPVATTHQAYSVRVADSAPIRHSQDTRLANESGIGIGTMLLKPTSSGKPAAYAWELGGTWKNNVRFAMARPLKFDV